MTFSRIIIASAAMLAAVDSAVARSLRQIDCDDDTCVELFGKCGGTNMTVSAACCDADASCVVKNFFYAQCLSEERAAKNVMSGWDGTVLEDCSEMPADTLMGPADTSRRRLQDAGSYGDTDCDDDMCVDAFEKCAGGYNETVACCDPAMQCTIKNWYYGQCLTPARAAVNVLNAGWDGRVLDACEDMPNDAPKGPDFWTWEQDDGVDVAMRRLAEAEKDCEDDTCMPMFAKCGGTDFNVSATCCDAGVECITKNYWYAQCLPVNRVEDKMASEGWDGRMLTCEEMPEDLEPKASRRLLDVGVAGTYGQLAGGVFGTYGQLDRGSAGLYGGYGDAPAAAPEQRKEMTSSLVLGSACEACAPMFGQCGDRGAIVSCCGAGLQCTKKNGFYAQCITPERATRNVEQLGWDGEALACGQIMA